MKLTTSEMRTWEGDAVLTVVLRQRRVVQPIDEKGAPVGEPQTIPGTEPWITVSPTDGRALLSRALDDKEYDEYAARVQALLGEATDPGAPEVAVSQVEARVTVERVVSGIDAINAGGIRL